MSHDNLLHRSCPHRNVTDDGRIVCRMIRAGDNEVSPHLCHDCPSRTAGCEHLRCSLQKVASSPITVRYATGRTETLEGQPARITFLQAGCAARVAPVQSPRECASCSLHSARAAATATAAAAAVASTPAPGGKVIAFPRRVAAAS